MGTLRLLAETPDAVPYAWVAAVVSALALTIAWLATQLVKVYREQYEREAARADRANALIERFVPDGEHGGDEK